MRDDEFRFWPWFVANWSRVALPGGLVLAVALATMTVESNWRLVLVALLLPVYMIHQYEEHAQGRFIAFVNDHIGNGLPILTNASVFWINILCVWALFLLVSGITRWVTPELVLIPVYATLMNGIIHIVTTLKLKVYNPGLYTSIALFLPVTVLCTWVWTRQLEHPWRATVIGLLGAFAVHAVLIGYAMRRKKALESG